MSLYHYMVTNTLVHKSLNEHDGIFWQAERARNDLERELEDLQDALDEQGGATQAQVL